MVMKEEHQRARFWSYAMTENTIAICRKEKDPGAIAFKFLQLLIQKIEKNKFKGQLESHQQLCKILTNCRDHKCTYCQKKMS